MAYSQFHDGFWTDPEIRRLSPEEKLIFIWFITNPSRHYSGIYFFEYENIPKQTGLSEKTVGKGIDTLSRLKFIKHNAEYSMVWVRKMARYEVVRGEKSGQFSEKQTRGIANHFKTLHNCPLIQGFMAFYPELDIPYTYPIRQEEEEEEEEVKEKEEIKDILSTPPSGVESVSVNDLANVWNRNAPAYLPRVNFPLSEKRIKKLRGSVNGRGGPETWATLFADIDKSPFYSGKDGKWTGMDFDWAVMNCEKLRGKLDRAISPKGQSSIGGKYDGIGTTFDTQD